jgi:hypothetical protein
VQGMPGKIGGTGCGQGSGEGEQAAAGVVRPAWTEASGHVKGHEALSGKSVLGRGVVG